MATETAPQTVAAVDLGSNSFHLIVARVRPGELMVLDRLKEMVRLAGGLRADRTLDPEVQEHALACLTRFGQRLQGLPADRVRVVGTNTLRSARNAGAFLERAEAALGHPVEIVSGMEEARLIYLGVAHSLAVDPTDRRLVVDIGGGSTELIVGDGYTPRRMESLYTGCVSLTREHFPDGGITAARFRRAYLAACQELEPWGEAFRTLGWDEAVGASGTIRAAAKVLDAAGWGEDGITRDGLERVRDALIRAGHADRLDLKGLGANRAPVFASGVAILLAAFEMLGIERMGAAEGALREGVLHDLMGRIRHEDVRETSVAALGERYHVDPAQAERVAATATHLLERAAPGWELDPAWAGPYLRWAAGLHEIGLDIAHGGYHKHGAYVAANADLLGFTREEQDLLAALIRAHRRKFPGGPFKALPDRWVRPARQLAVLLRLAAVLHRNRRPLPLPELEADAREGTLRLRFPGGWLEEHPLTRADLEQEAEFLAAAGFTLRIA